MLGNHVLSATDADINSRSLIVDNTGSDAVADLYENWLAAGIHIVSTNKLAGSGPYARYERILKASRQGNSRFLYEATVAAGLPVIGPLQGLLRAGDQIRIMRIISGTLSYIFDAWKPGVAFSQVVAEARKKGLTNQDPRVDLRCTEVVQKVIILARETGLRLEMQDVVAESLLPKRLRDWHPPAGAVPGDAFLEELATCDVEMAKLIDDADAAGQVLRFVGTVDVQAGTASVKLERFPKDSPTATKQLGNNIVEFETKYYSPQALVVEGPSTGGPIYAAGVFGNVLKICGRCEHDFA